MCYDEYAHTWATHWIQILHKNHGIQTVHTWAPKTVHKTHGIQTVSTWASNWIQIINKNRQIHTLHELLVVIEFFLEVSCNLKQRQHDLLSMSFQLPSENSNCYASFYPMKFQSRDFYEDDESIFNQFTGITIYTPSSNLAHCFLYNLVPYAYLWLTSSIHPIPKYNLIDLTVKCLRLFSH